jgi:hypothetical protein
MAVNLFVNTLLCEHKRRDFRVQGADGKASWEHSWGSVEFSSKTGRELGDFLAEIASHWGVSTFAMLQILRGRVETEST